MEIPELNQETVHGNTGLEQYLVKALQFSRDVSTGYIIGNKWYVDGDAAGSGDGKTWAKAWKTVGEAITASGAGDVIYVAPKTITAAATDPVSYEENLIIPNAKSSLSIIGVSRGRTQGGQPQFKDGTGTTVEILKVRAPGCLIANLGFNGAGNTGGGILLDESVSGYNAWGTTITNCHFKNCKGHATDSRQGGAINWGSNGGAWQVMISGNTFYKCVGDIVLEGTSSSRPQDVVIEKNVFSGPAANVDCNLYLAAGSGMNGVTISDNVFPTVGVPALGSGSVVRYIDATGCTGILAKNMFSFVSQAPAVTFAAAGTGAKIPATMRMAGNYGEADTEGDTGYIFRS